MKGRTLVLAIIVVLALGAVFFVSRSSSLRDAATVGQRPVAVLRGTTTVNSHDLIASLSSFIDTFERDGVLYASKRCDTEGRCNLYNPEALPAAAWRILQGVALREISADSVKGVAIIERSFERWKRRADGMVELHSFHQLLEAYRQSGSKELLGYTLNSLDLIERLGMHYVDRDEAKKSSPMLVATIARQLALVARTSDDSGPSQVDRERLLALSRRLVTKAQEMQTDHPGVLIRQHPELVGDFACWVPWAQSAIYSATKSVEDFSLISDFFERARFRERSLHDLDPGSLQMVLPCADVLAELRAERLEFALDLVALLERVILIGWDSAKMPLCDGDEGVFASPRFDYSGSSPCLGNVKSLSDNSWLMRILSKIPKIDLTIVRE